MGLRDLIAKFTIVSNPEILDKVNAGLDKTKQKAKEVGESSSHIEKLSSSFEFLKHAAEAFLGYEAIHKVYELAESFAKLGESIKITAEAMGLGVVEFQSLSFAAGQSGITQEHLATSLTRLSRALYEAKTGSEEAQEKFAHLGIPPGQLSQIKDTDQALLILSARIQKIDDPIKKLALTQQVLGRGSQAMVAFLSQGPAAIEAKMKQAAKEGLVFSESQVNGLERMNHAFEKLEAKLKVIFGSIIAPLAPLVEGLVNDFVKLYNENEKWLRLDFSKIIYGFSYLLGFIDGFVTTFVNRFRKNFPKGILGTIFGDFDFADKVTAIAAAANILIPVIFSIGAAVVPVAAEFAEFALSMAAIHDTIELLFGEGTFAEKLKKTYLAKPLANAVAGQANTDFYDVPNLNTLQKLGTWGAATELHGLASVAGSPRVDGNVNRITGDSVTNIFNVQGLDANHIAHVIDDRINRHDSQRKREIKRGVNYGKSGS